MRASVGVAVAGADDRTADELVRNADIAMYLAKSRGKGRLEVFEPSMQEAAMTQLQLRTDLAVGDRRPATCASTTSRSSTCAPGRTVGYEALVRWLRDGRLVPPGRLHPDRRIRAG